MALRPSVYWSDDVHPGSVCLGCGKTINYDEEIALVAVQASLGAEPTDAELDMVERFYLCSDCGTNVTKLVELGMKRIVAFQDGKPDSSFGLADIELSEPHSGEKKN